MFKQVLFVVFVILLIGCGGGDDKASPPPANMPPTTEPTPTITPTDVRTADPNTVRGTVGRISRAEPKFGSVVQSSVEVSSIASSFNGNRAVVAINRQGRGSIAIDTWDTIPGAVVGPVSSVLGISGRSTRGHGVLSYTSNSATLSNISIDYANDNASDYVMAGYWLHVEGDILNNVLTHVEAGVFVDGPEFSEFAPPTLPVRGTASYAGQAGGVYASQYGTDIPGGARGSIEVGEFEGAATFTADFSAMTISGCIGCVGDIRLVGVFYDAGTEEVFDFDVTTGNNIHMNAPISTAGRFTSDDIRVTNVAQTIIRSEKKWAGQFSNVPTADGSPRLVAGTFAVDITTSGGSVSGFAGVFGAGRQ